jgi:hypothetical protein
MAFVQLSPEFSKYIHVHIAAEIFNIKAQYICNDFLECELSWRSDGNIDNYYSSTDGNGVWDHLLEKKEVSFSDSTCLVVCVPMIICKLFGMNDIFNKINWTL